MNIFHDLKTPLTVIRGNLQAIKDGIYCMESWIDSTIDGVDEMEVESLFKEFYRQDKSRN